MGRTGLGRTFALLGAGLAVPATAALGLLAVPASSSGAATPSRASTGDYAVLVAGCDQGSDVLNVDFNNLPVGPVSYTYSVNGVVQATNYPAGYNMTAGGSFTSPLLNGVNPGVYDVSFTWTDPDGNTVTLQPDPTIVVLGNCTQPVVGMAPTPDGRGYWLVNSGGAVKAFGDATQEGDLSKLTLDSPIVGIAATSDGKGYWLDASDGGIFAFGDAHFFGSMGGKPLNKPIVGLAATPDGKGYWEVASDGGIFAFGDAHFFGSMGGKPLNKPVVGIAADLAPGGGYWEVASDGGIFSFGAPYFGSTGNLRLNEPIVEMEAATDGAGYRFVASDGGVFNYGDALYFGSLGGHNLPAPIVGMAASGIDGYWLVGSDGTVTPFGGARSLGSGAPG